MPQFQYSALSEAGEIVTGVLDAPSAEAVIASLHERALLPIDATERKAGGGAASLLERLGLRGPAAKLPLRDLALFSQQLARLLKAGLPLDRALDILSAIAGKRAAPIVRRTLDRVRDGASLSEAMGAQQGSFPSAYVSMIRAGEAGGALHAVLSRVSQFLLRSEAMRQRVVSASIYPAILLVAATVSIVLVLTVVLPQFEPMFREAGATLPTSTQLVIGAGDALQAYWWAMLLALLLAVLAWRQAMRREEIAERRDRILLSLPVVGGLITRYEIGRFCRTLGLLLGGGVPAPRALSLCGAAVANRAIAAAIGTAATQFSHGEGLSAPLARTGRFPPLSLQLIRIGEETGRLDEMLGEVADIYDDEVQRLLDRLLAMLVPAITVSMGVIVAFIIAAVMTALISINSLAM
jgi:general secretion pathway protein F